MVTQLSIPSLPGSAVSGLSTDPGFVNEFTTKCKRGVCVSMCMGACISYFVEGMGESSFSSDVS